MNLDENTKLYYFSQNPIINEFENTHLTPWIDLKLNNQANSYIPTEFGLSMNRVLLCSPNKTLLLKEISDAMFEIKMLTGKKINVDIEVSKYLDTNDLKKIIAYYKFQNILGLYEKSINNCLIFDRNNIKFDSILKAGMMYVILISILSLKLDKQFIPRISNCLKETKIAYISDLLDKIYSTNEDLLNYNNYSQDMIRVLNPNIRLLDKPPPEIYKSFIDLPLYHNTNSRTLFELRKINSTSWFWIKLPNIITYNDNATFFGNNNLFRRMLTYKFTREPNLKKGVEIDSELDYLKDQKVLPPEIMSYHGTRGSIVDRYPKYTEQIVAFYKSQGYDGLLEIQGKVVSLFNNDIVECVNVEPEKPNFYIDYLRFYLLFEQPSVSLEEIKKLAKEIKTKYFVNLQLNVNSSIDTTPLNQNLLREIERRYNVNETVP